MNRSKQEFLLNNIEFCNKLEILCREYHANICGAIYFDSYLEGAFGLNNTWPNMSYDYNDWAYEEGFIVC